MYDVCIPYDIKVIIDSFSLLFLFSLHVTTERDPMQGVKIFALMRASHKRKKQRLFVSMKLESRGKKRKDPTSPRQKS